MYKEILEAVERKLENDKNTDINPFKSSLNESEMYELTKRHYASLLLQYIKNLKGK